MRWSLSQFGARLCIALVVLIMSGCASPPPRGGRGGHEGGGPGGPGRFQAADGRMARPVALLFVSMDADRDLAVTAAELAEGIKAEWARADMDRNGVLSAFEMADWCRAVLGDPDATPGRLSLDTDVSGTVTPAEFETGLKKEFVALDRNADGRLDRSELLAPMGRAQDGDGGSHGVGGGQGGPGGGQGGGRGGGSGRHRPY